MYRKEVESSVVDLIRFKSNMGLAVSMKKAQYIWGKSAVKDLPDEILKKLERGTKESSYKTIKEKIYTAERNIHILYVFNWVRFIGISGSVAAGFVKEEDDIDLFIVVRNNCAWIYRGILTLKNIFNHVIRTKKDGESVKDLFCINFIVEERGLKLNSDIFNFHELMYLLPIYNERYLTYIHSRNKWLLNDFFTNKDLLRSREDSVKRVNIFIRVINYLAFLAQILFMLLTGHRPEIKRLFDNYKEGRIEFFPSGYKKKIMKEFNSYR